MNNLSKTAKVFCKYCERMENGEEQSLITCDDVVKNGTDEEMFDTLRKLVLRIRPHWSFSSVRYKVFTGGNTNKLFGLFSDSTAVKELILFRVYGNRTELYIDRSREWNNIIAFHKLNLASHPFMRFGNGVAYEFLDGEVADYDLLQDGEISSLVAREFARMHVESATPEFCAPPNDGLLNLNGQCNGRDRPMSYIESALQLFYGLIPEQFDDVDKQNKFVRIFGSRAALHREVDELLADIAQLDGPLVFCHNDLLPGNVVYQRAANRTRFIDWEYAAPNFAAFDLANHFVEFAGFENADFDLYPSAQYQRQFIRTYLLECSRKSKLLHVHSLRNGDANHAEPSEAEIDRWFVHVQHLSVATLLMWVLWALVQTHISTLSTDYLHYADVRYAAYLKAKRERLAIKLPLASSLGN